MGDIPAPASALDTEAMMMIRTFKAAVAAYVAAERHMRECGRGAKTLAQIGREIGTTKSTVRYWLRRDHWDLWMDHWASAEEIWEEMQRDKALLPRQQRDPLRQDDLKAELDRALAELIAGGMTE
jgi:predicted transcriptional regulator